MLKVTVGGLTCWCDTFRYTGTSTAWEKPLVMLSLFGARNAVRAAWARCAGRKRNGDLLHIGEDRVTLADDGKYITLQQPIGHQQLHLIMIHPLATHQCSVFATGFAQVGHDADVGYFSRLNRMCPVPFRPSWREPLWQMGLEAGLISSLPGFGVPAFKVAVAGDAWKAVVKQGITSGALT
jgi:hypothetical protein